MPASAEVTTQVDSRQYNIFKQFETMNTQAERWGLPPNQLAWCENLQILAPNKLQTVPGPGPATATIAGITIYREFFVSINGGDFIISFGTDGSGWQTNLAGGLVTQIGAAGTFSDPDVTTWQQQRILIADPGAGYSTWDGSVFVKPGSVSPQIRITNGGTGYVGSPLVVISGGSGSGAVAVAQTTGGAVSSIRLTSPGTGYRAGDILTVTILGSGIGATATVVVWPIFGFSFNTLAVAFGRVWLAGGNILQFTGTNGFDDANTANAAGFTTIPDADLVHRITALRSLNNFLYIFGDNSIKQIGTVTVTGATTVFAITTLSSDTGTVFPRSVQSYNRVVTFANFEGIWQIFGATVSKISDAMDGIFGSTIGTSKTSIDFSQDLQGVVATISGQRVYLLLVRYIDPLQNITRSLFLAYQGKKWYVVSQGNSVKACTTAVLNGKLQPYASSTNDITPILFDPNVAVAVILRTALDAQNKDNINKRVMRLGFTQFAGNGTINWTADSENVQLGASYTLATPINWLNATQQTVTWLNALNQLVTWVGGAFLWQEQPAGVTGIYVGVSITGTLSGFRFTSVVLEYKDSTLMRSRNT